MKYLTLLLLPLLASCSIGSGASVVSGFSYKAVEADRLSKDGEDKVADRVIEKIMLDHLDINPAQ